MNYLLVFISSLSISLNAFSATIAFTQVTIDATVSGSLEWAIAETNFPADINGPLPLINLSKKSIRLKENF